MWICLFSLLVILMSHSHTLYTVTLWHWIFVLLCVCVCVRFFLNTGLLHWILSSTFFFIVCIVELCLNTEMTELLNECEQPGLVQSLPLPEDLALRHLPALSAAHRRLDFTRRIPSLSSLQEVHTKPRTKGFSLEMFSVKELVSSAISAF